MLLQIRRSSFVYEGYTDMPPRSKQKHPRGWKKSKNYKKPAIKKKTNEVVDKKRRNFKFIRRGKDAEEFHRKQKVYEDKYAHTRTTAIYNDLTLDDLDSNEEETEDHYDALLTAVSTKRDDTSILSNDETDSDNTSDIENDSASEDAETSKEENNLSNLEENDIEESEDEDDELDDDMEKNVDIINDVLSTRLEYELSSEHVENLLRIPAETKKINIFYPEVGNLTLEVPCFNATENQSHISTSNIITYYKSLQTKLPPLTDSENLEKMGVKSTISVNMPLPFSQLQTEIFAIINNYQDLFFPYRTLENAEHLRKIYCLHALNHMLKTRSRIVHHNAKLAAISHDKKKVKSGFIVPDSYRDQGLVRPKLLIIVPFRESAFSIVNTLAKLLHGDKNDINKSVINYDRFVNEYTGDSIVFPKTNPKPEDYVKTFSGNTDDNFRIGISITKKCIKLYTEFYSSDILIASPLGLRLIIGASSSTERDYDFLNSIELLIIDQAELIFAQNWENLLHVMEHLHLPPQSLHNTDFQRVRPWCLNGYSRFYRQTILLSSHELPEFRSLFNSKCSNYQGKVRVANPVATGDIRNVIVNIPQIFHRIDVSSLETSFDQRFDYFINEVLPRYRNPSNAHCMIYIPSYFDYVRLRNHFKSETISFVQICEYTKEAKIARSRDMFYHSGAHFLLYSERSHFFRRTRIKGIRHLIMYQPPMWPHFYSEMINLMHSANQNARDGLESSMSIIILYTKYDILQLNKVLGTENATKLLKSGETSYAFTTE